MKQIEKKIFLNFPERGDDGYGEHGAACLHQAHPRAAGGLRLVHAGLFERWSEITVTLDYWTSCMLCIIVVSWGANLNIYHLCI